MPSDFTVQIIELNSHICSTVLYFKMQSSLIKSSLLHKSILTNVTGIGFIKDNNSVFRSIPWRMALDHGGFLTLISKAQLVLDFWHPCRNRVIVIPVQVKEAKLIQNLKDWPINMMHHQHQPQNRLTRERTHPCVNIGPKYRQNDSQSMYLPTFSAMAQLEAILGVKPASPGAFKTQSLCPGEIRI